MKKNMLILIFSLMAGAVIFTSLRYIGLLQDKARLEHELRETKKQAGLLEGQLRQEQELINRLNKEKRLLVNTLKEAEGKISQLGLKNAQSQEQIFSLVRELEDVHKETEQTAQAMAASQEKLKLLEVQNVELDTKLHSIPELKKAIRELKIQMRKHRPGIKPHLKPRTQISEAESNFGYLIRDGISTYRPRIKIEVKPAQ